MPAALKQRPWTIPLQQTVKPQFQFPWLIFLGKAADILPLQLTVSDLYGYPAAVMIPGIHPAVTHGLGLMERIDPVHLFQQTVCAFDLIDEHTVLPCHDTVSPSFQPQAILVILFFIAQRHFRLIILSHTLLNLPVHLGPQLHGFPVRRPCPCTVQITAAQDKFHQSAHRQFDRLFFFHLLKNKCRMPPRHPAPFFPL